MAEGASENVGIARAAVERAEGQRKQARSGYFPQLTGSATYTRTLESQFDIARDAVAQIPGRCLMPFTAQPAGGRPARLAGGRGRMRLALRRGRRRRVREPAVRPAQRLQLRPVALPAAVRRRAHRRAEPRGGRIAPGAEIGLTAAQAQLVLDVTQAYYDALLGGPAGGDRRGDAGAGGHDAGADPAGARRRQHLGVRSAARPGDPRQPASGAHPAPRRARPRLLRFSSC